jgi:hypothetical protein
LGVRLVIAIERVYQSDPYFFFIFFLF